MKSKEAVRAKTRSIFWRLCVDPPFRIVCFAVGSLIVNLAFAFYNGVLGLMTESLWFLTLCAYYCLLSLMRFSAVLFAYRLDNETASHPEAFVRRITGWMLMLLAMVLSVSVYLSQTAQTALPHPHILMIIIATYTFTKITTALVNTVRVRRRHSPLLTTLREIGCADAAASLLSLQRSMYATFGQEDVRVMNIATGVVVCLLIFLCGFRMVLHAPRRKHKSAA